jgi:glycosyltransferase involved in cell wall biosynthesis
MWAPEYSGSIMEQGPLVSAIIPTYNRATLVSDAIDSVLAQTYPHLEVIVVDDGSTDGTLDVLTRYGDRIQVISQPNAGPGAARNRGMLAAQGEMIAFLDSDDLWLPQKIARQVHLMQQLGEAAPCCLSNISMQWKNRESTSFDVAWLNPAVAEGVWYNPDEVLATRFVLFNQGVVIRREALKELGGFDESFRLLEDYDLALRLSLCGNWAFIRDPLAIWRENGTSSLSRDAARDDLHWQALLVKILEKQLHQLNPCNEHELLRKRLNQEIKRLRRQIMAAELGKKSVWGASIAGKAFERVERYRKAAFRRSPWFPNMRVEPVTSGTDSNTQKNAGTPVDRSAPDRLPASLHT